MSDKEQRVKWIGEQLHAGRIMLPVGTNTEWHREYLGEWADRPTGAMAVGVGVDLGVELSRGVVAHRCALCGVDLGDVMKPEIMAAVEQHHEVCEKRPIAVGDYVRWEYGPTMPGNWVEGEVVKVAFYHTVRIVAQGPQRRIDERGKAVEFGMTTGKEFRRIPRPVEAIELDCYVEWNPDGSRSRAAGQVIKMDGDRAIVRIREVSQTWTAFEACPFSGHARSIPLAQLKRIAWPHDGQGPVAQPRGGQHEPTPVAARPAPALVDGLTRAQCLERFAAYHREDVGMLGSKWANLTPAQTAAAREEWSAALRAKVAASDAADKARRPSVVVELQDVD